VRALIIGPDEQRRIRKVLAYALDRDHYYHPGITPVIPGHNPRYVAEIPDGFRCVFTITAHQAQLWRHLTVSLSGGRETDMYPSPEASVMIAKEFGFTASDDSLDVIVRAQRDGWMVSTGHKDEHCIVLIQPLEGATIT
jgi:hypothetical protein